MKTVKIGRCVVGKTPRIVGCLTSVRAARRWLKSKNAPFDIAEFRADLMGLEALCDGALCGEARRMGRPALLTVRSTREGGAWGGAPAGLLDFYARLLPLVSAIDVEIQSPVFKQAARMARDRRLEMVDDSTPE